MKYCVILLCFTLLFANLGIHETKCSATGTSENLNVEADVSPTLFTNDVIWVNTRYTIDNYSDGPPVNVTSFSHLQSFQFSLVPWGGMGWGIRIETNFDPDVDLVSANNQTDLLSEQFQRIFNLTSINEEIDRVNSSTAQHVSILLDEGYFFDSIETIEGMTAYVQGHGKELINRDYLSVYSQEGEVVYLVSFEYDATLDHGNLIWNFFIECNREYKSNQVDISLNHDLLNHTGPIDLPVSMEIYSGIAVNSISPLPSSTDTSSGITAMNWGPINDLTMSLSMKQNGSTDYTFAIIAAAIAFSIILAIAIFLKKKKRKRHGSNNSE